MCYSHGIFHHSDRATLKCVMVIESENTERERWFNSQHSRAIVLLQTTNETLHWTPTQLFWQRQNKQLTAVFSSSVDRGQPPMYRQLRLLSLSKCVFSSEIEIKQTSVNKKSLRVTLSLYLSHAVSYSPERRRWKCLCTFS